jgi:uncharacterized protein
MTPQTFSPVAANDNSPNPDRELLRAAEGNDVRRARHWLNHGADINTRHTNNDTPLIIAAQEGHEEMTRFLLRRRRVKADLSLQNNRGESALIAAVKAGNTKICSQLLNAGAPADLQDENGATAVFNAAAKGSDDAIDALAAAKADLNLPDHGKATPLMQAVKNRQTKAAGALLQHKADLDAQDRDGMTALMHAVLSGSGIMLKTLVALGANLELTNNDGMTALDLARKANNESVATILEQRLAELHDERYGPYHKGTDRSIAPLKPLSFRKPEGSP